MPHASLNWVGGLAGPDIPQVLKYQMFMVLEVSAPSSRGA